MLKKNPGQRLAYLPSAEIEPLAECLVAFANGDGGMIVLGVDENGRSTDTIWEEKRKVHCNEPPSYVYLLCPPIGNPSKRPTNS